MTTQSLGQRQMAMKDIVKVINKDKTFIAIQQEEGENDMYIIK